MKKAAWIPGSLFFTFWPDDVLKKIRMKLVRMIETLLIQNF